MTLNQFLRRLSTKTTQTREKWRIYEGGWIRLGKHCPLSFVAGTPPCSITKSAVALGLSLAMANRIADAADTISTNPRLRGRLLKAVGLEE